MTSISFSSPTNALRLVNPLLYPAADYPNGVMTYSFWGLLANGTQGTAEGRTGGYQRSSGVPTRFFLNVPADIQATVNAALANISKFVNLSFVQVSDTGFQFSQNRNLSQRGRIRVMVDGRGAANGTSHQTQSGDPQRGGETFYRPWTPTQTTTNLPRKASWTLQGQLLVSPTNYLNEVILHELQHSLGLGHGHDKGTVVNGVDTEHSPQTDNVWNTAQSYNGPVGWVGSGNESPVMVATSMPDDITALQSIYGAKPFNNEATTYTFLRGDLYRASSRRQLLDERIVDQKIPNINTLDDSAGIDYVDCSDVNAEFAREGVRVDIRPGGYVISRGDWDSPVSYRDTNGPVQGALIDGVPRKGTRLSWRTTIENVQGTEYGADTIIGNSIANWIAGYGGSDYLSGMGAADTLIGGPGGDQLVGGPDADLIYLGTGDGNADADIDFLDYGSASESMTGPTMDKIYGFGANDIIDLNNLDGNSRVAGRQPLAFIGSNVFSGASGELRVVGPSGIGSRGFVEADLNGDRVADFCVAMVGGSVLATSLTTSNFQLL